jgi:hypothetical protein
MYRSNSRSKWKDVLGFDDEGATLAYPSPPSSPPASSIYSGFREKLRPSTARSREKSREREPFQRPPSRESFWSRSHTRSHTNASRTTADSNQSRESFWSRSLSRKASRETFRPDTSQSRPYTSPTQANYPRFPKDITFFRSKSDILLSPSAPAPSKNDLKPLPPPPHLFYITIQKDTPTSPISTSRPDIILHSGAEKAATVLALAKFHSVTQATDITLCPPGPKPASANFSRTNFSLPIQTGRGGVEDPVKSPNRPRFKFEVLTPSGGIFTTERYSFCHTLPRTGARERFEWKYTSGPFVRTIESARESGGLKLIRSSTGDTVAVYAGLGPSSRASKPR